MKISFELTMPNVGSWNGRWTGQDNKYYLIKDFSKDAVRKNEHLLRLLVDEKPMHFYYNFGDGWGANVTAQVVDSHEAKKRAKISKGFCGYEWMVKSIIENGKILSTVVTS